MVIGRAESSAELQAPVCSSPLPSIASRLGKSFVVFLYFEFVIDDYGSLKKKSLPNVKSASTGKTG